MKETQSKSGTDYDRFREDFIVLLSKSEERIDRINDMVLKLVESTNVIVRNQEYIANEYVNQIRKLQTNRDDILNENKTLLHMLDKVVLGGTTNVNITKEDKYE